MYILIGICPSLATVNLNKVWALAFSPVASLIFGRMCLSNYDCWSSVTSLPESNKDGIWIPWPLMHTLVHLATTCCIISHFWFCLNGDIVNLINLAFFIISLTNREIIWSPISNSEITLNKRLVWELLFFCPLVWSMTKWGLSFQVVLVANPCCSFQAVCFPGPVSCLILHNSLSNGWCLCSTSKKSLGSGTHLSLEQVVGIWAFPSMACRCIHSCHWMYSGACCLH